MAHRSVIAIAGPQRLVKNMKADLEHANLFELIHVFEIPDDYGEFPDTTGYTAENWETMESVMEDPALYPFMTKCMDVCLDFTNKKEKELDILGHDEINKFVHWPKFGGKVFAVTGHVVSNGMKVPAISLQ